VIGYKVIIMAKFRIPLDERNEMWNKFNLISGLEHNTPTFQDGRLLLWRDVSTRPRRSGAAAAIVDGDGRRTWD
jgi:hypothetical protein